MIRIKVVRASSLALGAAIVLLALVVGLLAFLYLRTDAPAKALTQTEAAEVFAASAVREVVFGEDEHTDATDEDFVVEVVPPVSRQQPRVLIYHTHTHEAYAQTAQDPYIETEKWRTADPGHSVVRVGEELQRQLALLGVEAVHDVTDHEPPKLGTAYVRSLQTLRDEYAGEQFDAYIDLHRDAYDASLPEAVAVAAAPGESLAQLMVLIGNGEGFAEKPAFAVNYGFARALTEALNAQSPGLCRDVLVKNGRYNQHVGERAILIEVGHNRNTLSEALASMPYLARAICAVFQT